MITGKSNKKLNLRTSLAALTIAAELTLMLDAALALFEKPVGIPVMLAVFAAMTAILILSAYKFRGKPGVSCVCKSTATATPTAGFISKAAIVLTAAIASALLLVYGFWYLFSKNAVYEGCDTSTSAPGSTSFFSDQRIMLLVPHQDDDINLLGGAIGEYTSAGSDLYVVFTTNGDFLNTAEVRFNEAIKALSEYGIPEENIIFLGYGDQMTDEGYHIYNAPDGVVLTSLAGRSATYGTETHPSYSEGIPYTRENFLKDIRQVILDIMPDTIYCVDYDNHIDHRGTSLAFDTVMGGILKEYESYRPLVLKGFAYETAYEGAYDFYRLNMKSSVLETNLASCDLYNWNERVRIPVTATSLSRSLYTTQIYELAGVHRSQAMRFHAPHIINGDKVFFLRDTTSLAYLADFSATSGDLSDSASVSPSSASVPGATCRLSDFKICDSADLVEYGHQPLDGLWIPERYDDPEKILTMTFSEPVTADRIVIHENPVRTSNIYDAIVTIYSPSNNPASASATSGQVYTTFHTGPLNPAHGQKEFVFGETEISGITIQIMEFDGWEAGLAEVELFNSHIEFPGKLLKLQNSEGDFVYDYFIGESTTGTSDSAVPDTEVFTLYSIGCSSDPADYDITCDNDSCNVTTDAASLTAADAPDASGTDCPGYITVSCPRGESCRLTVAAKDGSVSDTVIIRNGGVEYYLMKYGQNLEAWVCQNVEKLRDTSAYRLAAGIFHSLGGSNL